jgi:ABC-type sulfate transport system substrate-binding protein
MWQTTKKWIQRGIRFYTITFEGAINKIRQVYGNVSVTKLIDSIVADKKRYPEGRHPNL